MKTNNNGIDTELKSKTLKAARKTYFTRKYVRVASVAAACVAVVFAAAIFLPANKPFPDNTMEAATATVEQEVFVDENIPTDEPLTLYTYADESSIKSLIEIYNNTTDGRKIVIPRNYDIQYSNHLRDTLLTELSAGIGPDIIFLSSNSMGLHRLEKSLIETGYLADMDIIINSHDDFNMSDYNTSVMDATLIDQKRYFIPYNYNVEYFISSVSKFNNLNLNIPSDFTIDAFFDLNESFNEKVPDENINIFHINQNYMLEILRDGRFESSEQNKRFSMLLIEQLKRLLNQPDYLDTLSEKWLVDSFIDNDILLYIPYIKYGLENQYLFLSEYYKALNQYNKTSSDEIILLPSPYNNEEDTRGYVDDCFAINAASSLKNEAFDFIKFMLSDEIQLSNDNSVKIPVSNKAYSEIKQNIYNAAKKDGLEKEAKTMFSLIEKADTYDFRVKNQYYYGFIFINEFFTYLNSDTEFNFDDLADSINRQIENYHYE